MLRCPPTTIVLGQRDLLEYEKRKKHRREVDTESINQQFARFAVGGPDGPRFGLDDVRTRQRLGIAKAEDNHLMNSPSLLIEDAVTPSSDSELDKADASFDPLLDTFQGEQSTENPTPSVVPRSSPIKNEFDYGGFVESIPPPDKDTLRRSSPFLVPEDSSTPPHGQHPDARRFHNRPLPRSPLFLSQNATSPDGRVTTRLTPRVVSRVATHNSPGIIFAQPPRRPPRASPRTLRHQTNSFSFDSSERASAAYEQERVVSNSTDDTTPHPSEDVSLHDELRGSSLQSSRVSSVAVLQEPTNDTVLDADETHINHREFLFSSPRLPLPPPFSSVSRRTSNTESLPSVSNESPVRASMNSPTRSHASTPNEDEDESTPPKLNASPIRAASEIRESPPSAGRISTFINRIRTASNRARSPLHHGAAPGPPASTFREDQVRPTSARLEPRTPSRTYRVYNDTLSPASQPQTPANLPEARHQSTYHPSYTAPVTRNAARLLVSTTTTDRASPRGSARRRDTIYTPVRTGRRNGSPSGMSDEGFQGLYGGRENGDEEQNWVEGVRFNNAEPRPWGERDAGNNGGSLRETPEPEDWRVGRRN